MKQVFVGKNVVRIMNREFPVDTDLSMLKLDSEHCAWRVDSLHQSHPFMPIIDDHVTAETFRTYKTALNTSLAFNRRGKMRVLFERKERGTKIIPGHGVFVLPSKMTVVQSGQRNIKLRVFAGTHLSHDFHSDNYSDMVSMASYHYREHFREFTDTVNESLYYPVKYNRKEVRVHNGFELPDGVTAMARSKVGDEVYYSSTEHGHVYLGTAKSAKELKEFIEEAEARRRKEHQLEAIYRHVTPSFIQLSQYMRQL